MAEYIERAALLKVLRGSAVGKYPVSFYVGLFAAAEEVEKIPAADVEVVKHGRWVDRYGGKYANPLYECSECKEAALKKDELTVLDNWITAQVLSAYCPHCGTKMDLEV